MEAIDNEYEKMEHGIKALLGQEDYDAPEKVQPPCQHASDGFIYHETPVFVTLQCEKCGIQYDISKLTGHIM